MRIWIYFKVAVAYYTHMSRERVAEWLAPWAFCDGHCGLPEAVGEEYVTGTGQQILGVHSPLHCAGRPCVIHAPSDHAMRDWPTNFRDGGPFDIKGPHMERICPHGIGHPDPDDAAFQASIGNDVSVHGCDGCCSPAIKRAIEEGQRC